MGAGLGVVPERAGALRALLDEAGYELGHLEALLGSDGGALVLEAQIPVLRARVEEAGALGVLARLFLFGDDVGEREAEAALGDGATLLVEAGVAAGGSRALRPLVQIAPHGHLLVAADRPGPDRARDAVGDVSASAASLARLTIRRPVRRALDVGTGGGIQALLVAPFAERVIATDVSERALAFAAFNAALNRIDNVELRQGSWLEPVEGERFGLVVANPPFGISPDDDSLIRFGGLARDAVSERMSTGIPRLLEEGGHASINVSWIVDGDDVLERPRRWLEGSGCDAWVLHEEPVDVWTHVAAWLADRGDDASVRRWLEYLRQEEIDRIGYGTLVLRRRGGKTWLAGVRLPDGYTQASEHLLRMFDAHEAATMPDARLLGLRVSAAPGTRVTHAAQRTHDGWEDAGADVTATNGLGFVVRGDDTAAAIAFALDGSRPLARVLDGLAAEERPVALAFVRRLVELGLATAAV